MNNFDFPTNIKQIGTISSGLRIYVEDYVCSYLQQYAEAGGYDERLATLVGRYITIDSQPVIFISGAILGKYCIEEAGIMTFSSKSYDYIEEQLNKYFSGLEVVGWMQSQPGYGTFLNPNYANYHFKNYEKPHQVMFVIDPIEKVNSFYVPNNKELYETKGYFVYYEKNHSMHEYMIENKVLRVISQTSAEQVNDTNNDTQKNFDLIQEKEKTKEFVETDKFEADNVVNIKNTRKRKKTNTQQSINGQKRIVNMLVSMCSVMLLICFVVAAGLIRSEDRISELENELELLNASYRNIVVALQSTQDAFAAQNTSTDMPVLIEENGADLLLDAQNNLEEELENDTTVHHIQEELDGVIPVSQDLDIPESYTVQPGDNLLQISMMFYGTTDMVEKIMETNNMTDADTIFHGKVLILPR